MKTNWPCRTSFPRRTARLRARSGPAGTAPAGPQAGRAKRDTRFDRRLHASTNRKDCDMTYTLYRKTEAGEKNVTVAHIRVRHALGAGSALSKVRRFPPS